MKENYVEKKLDPLPAVLRLGYLFLQLSFLKFCDLDWVEDGWLKLAFFTNVDNAVFIKR